MLAAFRCAFVVLLLSSALPAQWHQTDFPQEEFTARWARVFDKIGGDAVAVIQGVSQTSGFTLPRQTNEFYYLSGIETPHSYLLLDGRQKKVTLFLPPRNARLEASEGKVLSAEDADRVKSLTGADQVLSTEAMRPDFLGANRAAPATIYALFSPGEGNAQSRFELDQANSAILSDAWDGRLPRESRFAELLRARNPRSSVVDFTPILDELRSVKSPREVGLIRRASQIAGLAILEAIRSTKPGLYEYHLDAAARYVYLTNGARLEGYRSIAASGVANINNAHYYRNMSQLKDGDMVLLDFAPEYRYYTSDVTRMWPVNGKFAPWQRELLGFVLEYRNAVLKCIRPGVTTAQILEQAKKAMEPVFARTKFAKPGYEAAARTMVNTGGGVLSHPVGLTVHDDGAYNRGPLRPGHVFSIDPQLWVREESLYIRYEDVVVVTETGVENFTDFLASDLHEIEKLVGTGGVVQKVPPIPESATPAKR